MIGDKYGEGEVANISVDSQTLSLQTESAELMAGRKVESLCFFSKAPLHAVLFPYDVSRSVLHERTASLLFLLQRNMRELSSPSCVYGEICFASKPHLKTSK